MNDQQRALIPYEPNPLLGWLYDRFFSSIEVDETWSARVREADSRGTVIYVLRNLSFIDFFALDYLTKRLGLPEVRFANDLGLWILEPMGRGWLNALKPRTESNDAEDLRRAIRMGASAALFLKRPPRLLERIERQGANRGQREGDVFLQAVIEAQREQQRPILLVPQVFLWTKHGDEVRQTWVDAALGPREWPGKIRAVSQLLASYGGVTLRSGDPVDMKQFVASQEGGASDDVLVRRLTYTLLRRLERERRTVVGPTRKPADRLREEVLRSPKLAKIIGDMAGEGSAQRRVLTAKAETMIESLEATLDDNAMQLLDRAFDQTVARMYSAVEVDEEGLERVRSAAKEGTVILLPSHKSHVDYLMLTKILYDHHMQTPLVAAGDNLSFFPLGPILRRAGAFFIRRSFGGDRLYGAVVDAYMRRLIKDGWTLEFFLEGGRSRTGKLLPPKVGLLSIVVDAALGTPEQSVFFVPVSIGYERVVEEGAYVQEISGGEKSKEDVAGLLRSAKLAMDRYGRLSVQIGEIMTLEHVLKEIVPDAGEGALATLSPARRRAMITRLAHRVMNEINRVTAVTPGSLVATALLTHGGRGIAHDDLVDQCERLAETLRARGARFSPSLRSRNGIRVEAIREACELFIRAGHVIAQRPADVLSGKKPRRRNRLRAGPNIVYVVPDQGRLPLDISKNLIVHFFVDRGLVSTALLAAPGPPRPMEMLKDRVRALSRLFKYEFSFRADAGFDRIFEETIGAMIAAGEIEQSPMGVAPTEAKRAQVVLYARILASFIEGYRVAARSLVLLVRGPLLPRELARKAIPIGAKMHLSGEIHHREAVSQALFENAYSSFIDQGYLARASGKLGLVESYATEDAAATIEAKIAELRIE
jgi:glycerol-3-phosphate O-acyltransferase